MPSRNIIKEYVADSYYHVYARGINKQAIFPVAVDYRFFTNLFDRYISEESRISKTGEIYPNFKDKIQINSYCLMRNHFHLLIHQEDQLDLQAFMRSVMTSYSRYFNLKYRRTGPLFESRFKAVRIDSDQYLEHISRYIHLNPRFWQKYYNSSLKFYRENNPPYWLDINPILSHFDSIEEYMNFLSDYEGNRDMLEEIKYQLADK